MKKTELIEVIRRHDIILNEAFPFEDSFFQSESENPKNKPHLLEIQETRSKFIRNFNAYSSDFTISIKNTELIKDPSGDEQVDLITRALEEMIEVAKRRTNFRNHDRINIVIRNPVLHYPVSTGCQRGNSTQDLVQIIIETISRILTSNEELDLITSTFNVIIIAIPQGANPKGSKILNLAEAKQTKNSTVQIKNKDNLCCPRAVIVALTYPEENPPITTIFNNIFSKNEITYIQNGRKLQTDLTTELCNQLSN